MQPRLFTRIISFLLFVVPSIAGKSFAQTAQPAQTTSAPLPVAAAAPVTGSISIDGKLDEAAWAQAKPITDFRQQQPHEGLPASQRTEVRVLYSEHALYIGARMYDSLGARGIIAPVSRRDQLLDSNGNNGSFNSLTSDK